MCLVSSSTHHLPTAQTPSIVPNNAQILTRRTEAAITDAQILAEPVIVAQPVDPDLQSAPSEPTSFPLSILAVLALRSQRPSAAAAHRQNQRINLQTLEQLLCPPVRASGHD